jgi:uncharacterized protein (DUF488 family)
VAVPLRRVEMVRTARKNGPKYFFTVGYEGRSLEEFVLLLKESGIEQLLDVRFNPISRKPGFSKTAIKSALEVAGIQYVHLRALGIPSQYRAEMKSPSDFTGLFEFYAETLLPAAGSDVWKAGELVSQAKSALMCFEQEACMCHRHVLARELARTTRMEVHHL